MVPGGSTRIADVTLAQVTTGRSVLWGKLWRRGADALPFGNGWGYTWSLTSTELFGFEGVFGAEGIRYTLTMTSCSSSWNSES